MALFGTVTDTTGIFSLSGSPTAVTLDFERASHSVTSYGHVSLAFYSAYSVMIDMQPGGGKFLRRLAGEAEPMAYTGRTGGFVDMQRGDRASYISSLLEIANVQHFGTHHTTAIFQIVR